MRDLFFGFDPGGQNNFGWAVLEMGNSDQAKILDKGTVSDAQQAISEALRAAESVAPKGVGIDAPLHWTLNGSRQVDQYLRSKIKGAGRVQQVNSLRGACLVQGVLAAKIIRARYPNIPITETHPKALWEIWEHAQFFAEKHCEAYNVNPQCQHESDAILSAYCAWNMAIKNENWEDLLINRESGEYFFPAGSPSIYWFPCL